MFNIYNVNIVSKKELNMEFEDNKINDYKKLDSLKVQFDNSMKRLEKNIAESIINKQKLNDLKQGLLSANKKFIAAEKYLEEIKIKFKKKY